MRLQTAVAGVGVHVLGIFVTHADARNRAKKHPVRRLCLAYFKMKMRPKIRSWSRKIAAISCMLTSPVLAAAANDVSAEFLLLQVDGAKDIQRHSFPDVDGRGLTYRVPLEYPGMAVGEDHFKQLRDRGWSECSGTKAQWDSHIDADGKQFSCVHEFARYFTKDSRLMLVSLKYRSTLKPQAACPAKPSSKNQFVVVTVYNHPDRNTLQLAMQPLKLSCGGER